MADLESAHGLHHVVDTLSLFDSMDGCAKAIVAKAKDAGLVMTGAGATFPMEKIQRTAISVLHLLIQLLRN